MEFIDFYFKEFLACISGSGYDPDAMKLCLMAIIHQNKHNNIIFKDLKEEFQLIRDVCHNYTQAAESSLIDDKNMRLIFWWFSIQYSKTDSEQQCFIQKQIITNEKNKF